MQGPFLRKYGAITTILFDVFEIDGVDLNSAWTPVQADCEISKNEGAFTAVTATANSKGGGVYSLALTAVEMQAARIIIKIVDAATKVILDKTISIETYGNASAQHEMDFDEALENLSYDEAETACDQALTYNARITSILSYIGVPANIDGGGASLAENLKKLADDNAGGNFDASLHSLERIRDRGDLAWLTGAGATASKAYTITTITRTVGDDDGGDENDVNVVDGNYHATGEINSTTLLEVDVTFTADDGAEDPNSLLVWGFYFGGGTHHIDVKAYNYTASAFELIGEMPKETAVIAYQFPLTPDHINPSTGAMAFKLIHSPGTGIITHVLNIDKIQATTATASIALELLEALPIASEITTAILAMTGITAGNTLTFAQGMKILLAITSGNVRDKDGSPGVHEILDADDGTTVIAEITPGESTPYRSLTLI